MFDWQSTIAHVHSLIVWRARAQLLLRRAHTTRIHTCMHTLVYIYSMHLCLARLLLGEDGTHMLMCSKYMCVSEADIGYSCSSGSPPLLAPLL